MAFVLVVSFMIHFARDQRPRIAVSDSQGHLHIANQTESGAFEAVLSWKAHEYEAWIAAFNHLDPTTVFSGDLLLVSVVSFDL